MHSLIERLEGRRLFANPHFVTTDYTDDGTTLVVDGKLAGFGNNDDVTLQLTAEGTATVLLVNPAGHVLKHSKEVGVTVSGELATFSDHNGNVIFTVETTAPTAEGGPNSKWSAAVTDVQFISAELYVPEEGLLDTITF